MYTHYFEEYNKKACKLNKILEHKDQIPTSDRRYISYFYNSTNFKNGRVLVIQDDDFSQTNFKKIIEECYETLEELIIKRTPNIKDFSLLEKCTKLKYVDIMHNKYVSSKLWDFAKTPNLEALVLGNFTRFVNYQCLSEAKSLKYLSIDDYLEGRYPPLDNLNFISELPQLVEINIFKEVADRSLLPIISHPNLQQAYFHPAYFDLESFAMLEARRPDLSLNYEKGIYNDCIYMGAKYLETIDEMDEKKRERINTKYMSDMQKYKESIFIPKIKTQNEEFPMAKWLKSAKEWGCSASDLLAFETMITTYQQDIKAALKLNEAKKILRCLIRQLNAFNEKTEYIETQEREELYDCISSLFNLKWYEKLEDILENERDW